MLNITLKNSFVFYHDLVTALCAAILFFSFLFLFFFSFFFFSLEHKHGKIALRGDVSVIALYGRSLLGRRPYVSPVFVVFAKWGSATNFDLLRALLTEIMSA